MVLAVLDRSRFQHTGLGWLLAVMRRGLPVRCGVPSQEEGLRKEHAHSEQWLNRLDFLYLPQSLAAHT